MFMARAMCGLTYVTIVLCKYLERWLAVFSEAGQSVSVLMKGPTLTSVEVNTFHF